MSNVNQLNAADTINQSDLFLIWQQQNGDSRKVSAYTLAQYILSQLVAGQVTRQYSAPSATGFSITVTDNQSNVWLTITPVAGYAAGTLVLPALANSIDQQEITVNCTQAVTTLTISGNGSTVTGAPTTLAANAYFKLKYDAIMHVWYRIG
jgi:hypothetical protein